ncbi:MAG TPA: M48 family peptidase [Nitrososphaeria archaeon]|nr:M48 family peptidase [Nitrososphaeria archaeon]
MAAQIPCPRCGAFTDVEKVFCVRCGNRVIPLTRYDLTASDFIYLPDRDALESLKNLGPLSPIIDELVVKRYIRSALSRLSEEGERLSLSSELGSLLRECGLILGLESLPETYIIRSRSLTAFTFGSNKSQFLVLSSGLLRSLDRDELKAAIGHELGHIKCGHIKYHTLAEVLVRGVEYSLGVLGGALNMLSPAIRLMLLSWHRESEISADRAGLIAVGDSEKVVSLLRKLHRGFGGVGNSVGELFSTHPAYENRVKHILEYYGSEEYRRVRGKVERRLKLSKALSPICRFCRSSKPLTSLFCPSCGRSQL